MRGVTLAKPERSVQVGVGRGMLLRVCPQRVRGRPQRGRWIGWTGGVWEHGPSLAVPICDVERLLGAPWGKPCLPYGFGYSVEGRSRLLPVVARLGGHVSGVPRCWVQSPAPFLL